MSAPQPPAGPQPPTGPYPPYGTPMPGAGPRPADHPQAVVVLVLGIVGLTVFQVCAPIAWYLGSKAKREIETSDGAVGGLNLVNLGRILGMVGTAILALALLIVLAAAAVVIVVAVSAA